MRHALSHATHRRTISTLLRPVVLLFFATMFVAAQSQILLAKSSVAVILGDGVVDRFLTQETPDRINSPRSYFEIRGRDDGLPDFAHPPFGDWVATCEAAPAPIERSDAARSWPLAAAAPPRLSPVPPARGPPADHRENSVTGQDHGDDA